MQWTERIERRVKLRDLHTLLVLVQCGSMGRAAKLLAISQPVVSKPTAGELRVGGAGPFVDGLIPAAVSGLAERYPKIAFHVTESDPPALCRLVRERRIDLAILRTSASMYSDDLELAPLFAEPLFVIAGLDNPLSRRRRLDLSDLSDEPWALPEPENVARTLIEEEFRSAGIATPIPQVVSDSTTLRTRLVEMGRFLTFLPASTLHFAAGRRRIKVLPVKLVMKTPPTEIVTLKSRTPNPIAQLLIAELHSVAKPLKNTGGANTKGGAR